MMNFNEAIKALPEYILPEVANLREDEFNILRRFSNGAKR
jgi:hypothetical protein